MAIAVWSLTETVKVEGTVEARCVGVYAYRSDALTEVADRTKAWNAVADETAYTDFRFGSFDDDDRITFVAPPRPGFRDYGFVVAYRLQAHLVHPGRVDSRIR